MGRYNPSDDDDNIGVRILGWLMGALMAAAALAGIVIGIKWLWHHFIH